MKHLLHQFLFLLTSIQLNSLSQFIFPYFSNPRQISALNGIHSARLNLRESLEGNKCTEANNSKLLYIEGKKRRECETRNVVKCAIRDAKSCYTGGG